MLINEIDLILSFSDQETLDKSREIIKKLKDEKKQIIIESEDRIKQAEKTIEEEKENLIHELSRAKTAAVSCLQVGKAKEEEKENLIHELSTAVMFTGG